MSNNEEDLFSNDCATFSDSLSTSSVEVPYYLKTPVNQNNKPSQSIKSYIINSKTTNVVSINDFNNPNKIELINNSFINNSVKSLKDSRKSTSALSDKENTEFVGDFDENKSLLVQNWLDSFPKLPQTPPLETNEICETALDELTNQIEELEAEKSTENNSIFSSDSENEEDENAQMISCFGPPKIEKFEEIIANLQLDNPNSDAKLNFIHSLLNGIDNKYRDEEAERFRLNYKYWKLDLAKRIFQIYNESVFFNQLPSDTKIFFNPRLLTTGGLCEYINEEKQVPRHIEIQLSPKICTDSQRLLEIMVHEMCHGATFMINKSWENHGPVWNTWAIGCKLAFPLVALSRNCHNYTANFKYQYRCKACGFVINRHSKKKDLKECKKCKGELILFSDGGYGIHLKVDTNKSIEGFAGFVKENYKSARSKDTTHKEAMQILSKQFYLQKLQLERDRTNKLLGSPFKL